MLIWQILQKIMLSKNQIKNVRALSLKKNRDEQRLFVAEGEKLVGDLLSFLVCRSLFVTKKCTMEHSKQTIPEYVILDELDEMKKISFLTTPTSILAVFEQPNLVLNVPKLNNELILVLDEVQNPGNLGTILRIADWFGISNVICSFTTADVFNPKTVQATMGALARVKVHYVNLLEFFDLYQSLDLPIYGTFLDGDNMYKTHLSGVGAIIFGNEGKGISAEVEKFISSRLFIPNYPADIKTSESLNVAVATAIVCAEFRRN